MNIMVGCPVYDRAWIMPSYFQYVERSFKKAGLKPQYLFVLPTHDESTRLAIADNATNVTMVMVEERMKTSERRWNTDRYLEMVNLRNHLLQIVRDFEPDLFLSLDSDILIHEDVVANLIESLDRFDAVGGKCFMTELLTMNGNTTCPSWANLGREGQLLRQNADGVFPVQVIMAIKLMTPKAYAIDYEYHTHGEDIGWSLNCARNAVKLGHDGRVTSKHVMTKQMMDRVDPRAGY